MNKTTDWYDASRIALKTKVHVNTVRYHWRRAATLLDLPPEASGFLDEVRAARLIRYLTTKQCNMRPRRRASRP